MSRYNPHDVPILRGSVSMRSPRSVLLLNPFQVPLALALWVVSVIFTIWPEALEHSPISFEQRGVVHHIWHYALLLSSGLILVGMFAASRRRLQIELVGLLLLIGVLGMNLVAVIADALAVPTDEAALSGIDVAVRLAAVIGLAIRAFIIATEPKVELRADESTA